MRDVIKAMTDLFDANVPHDLDELDRHVPMIDEIESFWRNPPQSAGEKLAGSW